MPSPSLDCDTGTISHFWTLCFPTKNDTLGALAESENVTKLKTYAAIDLESGHLSMVAWNFMFSICFLSISLSIWASMERSSLLLSMRGACRRLIRAKKKTRRGPTVTTPTSSWSARALRRRNDVTHGGFDRGYWITWPGHRPTSDGMQLATEQSSWRTSFAHLPVRKWDESSVHRPFL